MSSEIDKLCDDTVYRIVNLPLADLKAAINRNFPGNIASNQARMDLFTRLQTLAILATNDKCM